MNTNYIAEYKHVRIRPLRHDDIEKLREWRNNSTISEFLSPIPEITKEMQQRWYENYLTDTTNITFAIEEISELNRLVGSCSVYDIRDNKAEFGKIVVGDPEAKGKKIGYFGMLLALFLGFEKLGIKSFLGEVHEDNNAAKINDLRVGYLVKGKQPFVKGGYELVLELPKEHFYEIHDFLHEILIKEC